MFINIVFTNELLFRLKMIESPLCTFCKQEIESIEHLFFYCNVTKSFWEVFCSILLEPLERSLAEVLIPSITERNCSPTEWDLLELPVAVGWTGVFKPGRECR